MPARGVESTQPTQHHREHAMRFGAGRDATHCSAGVVAASKSPATSDASRSIGSGFGWQTSRE